VEGRADSVRQHRPKRHLATRISRCQRSSVDKIVEHGQSGAEDRDGGEPHAQSAQCYDARAPSHDRRHHSTAQDHHIGVPDEYSGLECDESREAHPDPACGAGVRGQHRPEHEAAAGGDLRRIGERRHVLAPAEQQRRAGRAVQADRGRPTEPAQSVPRADEQPRTRQRSKEQRRPANDPERFERCSEKG
jgi:hypothetical protein